MTSIQAIIYKHWAITSLVFLYFLIYAIPALNIQSFILTGQDYNPIYFGKLLWGEADISFGDSEVGINRSFFSLSNLYFLLPAILYKIGLPLESMSFIHTLFAFPLFILLYYAASYTLFKSRRVALFSFGLLSLGNFTYFKANLGYPMLFQHSLYYGDFNHIFVLAALILLFRNKILGASIAAGLLVLFNPTYGINLCLLLGLYLLVSKKIFYKESIYSLGIMSISCAAALLMVQYATPYSDPIADDIRSIAIQGYSHIAPHVYDLKSYFIAQIFLVLGIFLALLTVKDPKIKQVSLAVICLYFLYAQISYWFFYIIKPEIFILLSPGKSLMIITLFITLFYGRYLFNFFVERHWLCSLIITALFVYLLQFYHGIDLTKKIWLYTIYTVLGVAIISFNFPALNHLKAKSVVTLIPIIIFLLLGILQTSWLFSGQNYWGSRQALLNISKEISKITDPIYIAPIFIDETNLNNLNPYNFISMPARTYSNKNLISFGVGRNSYFNSQMRHELEELNFEALEMSLWDDIVQEVAALRSKSSFSYYVGYNGGFTSAGANLLIHQKVKEIRSIISNMTLQEYTEYTKKLGATHLLIAHLPTDRAKINNSILQNDYFSFVKID